MKNQIKRLAAPKTWPIPRKERMWIAKPLPGANPLEHSLALVVILRDILNIAKTSRDIKRILSKGEVTVNGRSVKDKNYGAGLFDIISIPKLNKHYRILLSTNNKLHVVEVSNKESSLLPLQVQSKTMIKGKKLQINLTKGRNLLDGNKYNVGDTVIFDTSSNKVVKHISRKDGCLITAIFGKHVGKLANLKSIKGEGELKKRKIATLVSDKEEWRTLADSLFVVGEDKPEFTAVAK